MIYNFFPTPVGAYLLDRELNEKEFSFIRDQKTRGNSGNTVSVDNYVLDRKELTDLRKSITVVLNDFFNKVYNPVNDVSLRITQSWCNYTEPGGFHHRHSHRNSFISGVFYPQADIEKDQIFFYRDGYQQIKIMSEQWNEWNSNSKWLGIKTGSLLLFPSDLEHDVPKTESSETRISLAFNTFPVGCVGDNLGLTELHLA